MMFESQQKNPEVNLKSNQPLALGTAAACLSTLATGLASTFSPLAQAQPQSRATIATAHNTNIALAFDAQTKTQITALFGGKSVIVGPFALSESIVVNGKRLEQFNIVQHRASSISDARGPGRRLTIIAEAADIEKEETADAFPAFPAMLFLNVRYTNRGNRSVSVASWRNQAHTIQAGPLKNPVAFWSLESGSYEPRPDWVVPLKPGFHQQNYLGMNADDYGGGTPVIDVWRPDVGIAVGHDELTPELVSEPVVMPSAQSATIAVDYQHQQSLHPGESFKTFETFVAVHTGDYFNVLQEYRRLMIAKGVRFENAPADGFQPIWCAWGFGRNFQPEQIIAALPEAKNWDSAGSPWTMAGKPRKAIGSSIPKSFRAAIRTSALL